MEDHDHHRMGRLIQMGNEFHEVELMMDIEIRRRFVEKEDFRFFRQSQGQPGALPFAAGKFGQAVMPELRHFRFFQGLIGRPYIVFAEAGKQSLIGQAPHEDQIAYGHVSRSLCRLGQEGNNTGQGIG